MSIWMVLYLIGAAVWVGFFAYVLLTARLSQEDIDNIDAPWPGNW